jgi:hypothetical protein
LVFRGTVVRGNKVRGTVVRGKDVVPPKHVMYNLFQITAAPFGVRLT